MEIDQRIVLGVALVAILISIFTYKEVLDMRCLITGGTPTPEPMFQTETETETETPAEEPVEE
jgi:hypothetical protein